jgi:type II secretory pathway pseudopilin PulG
MTRRARGMTRVEAMVVVANLGLFLGTGAVYAFVQREKKKIHQTRLAMYDVHRAFLRFRTEKGVACPKSVTELFADAGGKGPPVDAWGEPFELICPGDYNREGADFFSKGRDKQMGTPDDIRSWAP